MCEVDRAVHCSMLVRRRKLQLFGIARRSARSTSMGDHVCAPTPQVVIPSDGRGIPPSYLKGFAQGSLDPAAAGLGMTAGFGRRFQAFAAAGASTSFTIKSCASPRWSSPSVRIFARSPPFSLRNSFAPGAMATSIHSQGAQCCVPRNFTP